MNRIECSHKSAQTRAAVEIEFTHRETGTVTARETQMQCRLNTYSREPRT